MLIILILLNFVAKLTLNDLFHFDKIYFLVTVKSSNICEHRKKTWCKRNFLHRYPVDISFSDSLSLKNIKNTSKNTLSFYTLVCFVIISFLILITPGLNAFIHTLFGSPPNVYQIFTVHLNNPSSFIFCPFFVFIFVTNC